MSQVVDSSKFVTPVCRLSYPKLARALGSKFHNAAQKAKNARAFEAVGIFEGKVPPLMLQKVEAAIAAKWTTRPAKIEMPWKNNADRTNDAGEIVKGYEVPGFHVTFRNKGDDDNPPIQPAFVGPTREVIPASTFYAGCYVAIQTRVYGWEFEGKKGIGFDLLAVQFVRHGDRLGRDNQPDLDAFNEFDPIGLEQEGDTSLGDFVPF